MCNLRRQITSGMQEIHDDHFVIIFQKHDEVLTSAGETQVLFDTINQNLAALVRRGAIGDLLAPKDQVVFIGIGLTWPKCLECPNRDICEVVFGLPG